MDAFVVSVSLANICIDTLGYSGILQLDVLRVLRIVRILKVSSQVKYVLDCLIQSLQKMVYFLVLYMIMLFVYSVIGKYDDYFHDASSTGSRRTKNYTEENK